MGLTRLIRAITSPTGPRREEADELAEEVKKARAKNDHAAEENREAVRVLLEEFVSQMQAKRG